VCLIITRINIQELDGFKYDQNSQRRQNRSKSVTKKIHEILSSSLKSEIPNRPGVSLQLLRKTPNLDNFDELNAKNNDDQMIASILEFIETDQSNQDTILITADIGPKLIAESYGIQTISLDETYLLKAEPSLSEKKLRLAEKQISNLQQQKPQVEFSLVNSNESNLITIQQENKNKVLEESLR